MPQAKKWAGYESLAPKNICCYDEPDRRSTGCIHHALASNNFLDNQRCDIIISSDILYIYELTAPLFPLLYQCPQKFPHKLPLK